MTIPIEIEEEGPLDYLLTILAAAQGSIGSAEYRHVFIKRVDVVEDVTCDGEYSCALSTSTIYHRFGLLSASHSLVKAFEDEIRSSNDWIQIEEAQPGAVGILEGKKHHDGSVKNRHTFICIGHGLAVHNGLSNGVWSPESCAIEDFKHHTGEQRLVEVYYIHKSLIG
jgi:hypothetical protein